MKINVRNEPATAADEPAGSEATPARTCVWVVGDDGETQSTAYPQPGEEVSIEIGFIQASQSASVGEVRPIEPPPAA